MFNKTGVRGTAEPRAKQAMKDLSKGCEMYSPCPICFKCENKATHLYHRCNGCKVMHCGHNHKHKSFMIRRENFGITVSNETGEQLKALSERCECNEKE